MMDNGDQVTTDILTQVGLRGTGWSHGDIGWGRDQGWRVVQAEEGWHKSGPRLQWSHNRLTCDVQIAGAPDD